MRTTSKSFARRSGLAFLFVLVAAVPAAAQPSSDGRFTIVRISSTAADALCVGGTGLTPATCGGGMSAKTVLLTGGDATTFFTIKRTSGSTTVITMATDANGHSQVIFRNNSGVAKHTFNGETGAYTAAGPVQAETLTATSSVVYLNAAATRYLAYQSGSDYYELVASELRVPTIRVSTSILGSPAATLGATSVTTLTAGTSVIIGNETIIDAGTGISASGAITASGALTSSAGGGSSTVVNNGLIYNVGSTAQSMTLAGDSSIGDYFVAYGATHATKASRLELLSRSATPIKTLGAGGLDVRNLADSAFAPLRSSTYTSTGSVVVGGGNLQLDSTVSLDVVSGNIYLNRVSDFASTHTGEFRFRDYALGTVGGILNWATNAHAKLFALDRTTPAAFTAGAGNLASLAVGTNPSSTGAVRLANNEFVIARNQANSADISLIGLSTANDVSIAPGGAQTNFGGNIQIGGANPTAYFGSRGIIRALADGRFIWTNNAQTGGGQLDVTTADQWFLKSTSNTDAATFKANVLNATGGVTIGAATSGFGAFRMKSSAASSTGGFSIERASNDGSFRIYDDGSAWVISPAFSTGGDLKPINVYTSIGGTLAMSIDKDNGRVSLPANYANTTANAPNMYTDSAGLVHRSTASLALTTGSYADPAWITSLAGSKVTALAGSWTSKSVDTVYQAATDGYLIVSVDCGDYLDDCGAEIEIFSDGSNPPTTLRGQDSVDAFHSTVTKGAVSAFIKKNDYYKAGRTTISGSPSYTVYFLPIGG
jgi:hypothetical protein